MKKILLKTAVVLGSAALGYYIGYSLGVSLHDFLEVYPITKFGNESWFDPNLYINLYEKYSFGLRELFGKVFGITGMGIGSYFGYEIQKVL